MKNTRLGRSGLEVSRIVLGCMGFGSSTVGTHHWAVGIDEARPVVRAALDAGITLFDTANVYSGGASEQIIGGLLKEFGVRDEVSVATKVSGRMGPGPNGGGLSRGAIFAQVDASLRRLGTDYIDLYQIHRLDPLTPWGETMEALNHLVVAGKVRYIGASSMAAWQFAQAQHVADLHGWTRFISMQDQYNLLMREEEREMLPFCLDEGIGVMPWSPLARGRLTREWGAQTARTRGDAFGETLYRQDEESDKSIVREVGSIAHERSLSRAQVALAWLSSKSAVSAPIIGATTAAHIADAVAALDVELTSDELQRLEAPYTPRAPEAI